jgi:hypothetical protein
MDGKWGIHINRKITWWEQSHAWFSYLGRCQFMLQQGRFVGDILVCTAPRKRSAGRLRSVALGIEEG